MFNFSIIFYRVIPFSDDIVVCSFDNLIVFEHWEDCVDVYCDDGQMCHCVDYQDFDYFKVVRKYD